MFRSVNLCHFTLTFNGTMRNPSHCQSCCHKYLYSAWQKFGPAWVPIDLKDVNDNFPAQVQQTSPFLFWSKHAKHFFACIVGFENFNCWLHRCEKIRTAWPKIHNHIVLVYCGGNVSQNFDWETCLSWIGLSGANINFWLQEVKQFKPGPFCKNVVICNVVSFEKWLEKNYHIKLGTSSSLDITVVWGFPMGPS